MVLDTTVLIRAHGKSRSLPRKLLFLILSGPHKLVISNEIIYETTRVLRYPKFQSWYGLSESELLEFGQLLRSVSDLVILDPHYTAPLRDANDLDVLQTAVRGEADVLCTNDKDFYDPAILAFCTSRQIAVRDEVSLLAELAGPVW